MVAFGLPDYSQRAGQIADQRPGLGGHQAVLVVRTHSVAAQRCGDSVTAGTSGTARKSQHSSSDLVNDGKLLPG